MTGRKLWPVLAAAALALSACGGSESPVVRPPDSSAPAQSSSPPSSGGPSQSATVEVNPRTKVVPHTGLTDGQVVTVTASGFSPGKSLIVVQCVDKGQQTGPGDCNLADSITITTDASGGATAMLTVTPGPFGGNGVVCGAKLHCLVSVTEASPTPTEEADTPISFG